MGVTHLHLAIGGVAHRDDRVLGVQDLGRRCRSVGQQSLSEVLHHPSSLREICLYRIGAYEQGLDLRKMEPKKAKKW